MNKQELTAQVVSLIKQAQLNPADEPLLKAWTQPGTATTGIASYDLEAPAKMLFPVLTPLRNRIPRVSGRGGIQANWRAITGINTSLLSAGVGQGNRGGVISSSTRDYTASYKGIGLEDYVTFEADYAAEYFQDLKATAVDNLLKGAMIAEEKIILGGNTSLALGTTPTPSAAASNVGGALADNGNYSVICVALNAEATWSMGGFNNGFTGQQMAPGIDLTTALVPQQISRTNADGSVETYGGGAAKKSAAAAGLAVNGGTGLGSVTASVTPVRGAFAYAWFFGVAGAERLAAVTYINSAKFSALPGGGNQTAAGLVNTDYSTNALVFDGLLTFASDPAGGSYYATQATGTAGTGTPLTANGDGGVTEIDAALQAFWDLYRLSPTRMLVSSQEQKNITKAVLKGQSNAAQRFVVNTNQGNVAGGFKVTSYLNQFTMGGAKDLPIELHPNMIPGTIFFECDELPYPLSNVVNVLQMRTRRDYYQLEWPLRTRKYEYGVYADEVLQNFFPPAFGMISNIADGVA